MSSVKFLFPKLRLASQLREAGGLPVVEALEAAETNLGELQPQALATLRATADEALAVFKTFPASFDAAPLQQLYSIAARGVGCGAIAGAPVADQVMVSLCDLADHLGMSQRWDLEAIGVHVSTLQLVAQGAADHAAPAGLEKLLEGLKKVTARYAGDQEQPAA